MTVTEVRTPRFARNEEPRSLTPLERLEFLCDPGSVGVIRSGVTSAKMGDRALAGDGVIGAAGRINGRPVFCFAQDASFAGGSLGQQHAETVLRVMRLAGSTGAPIVGFVESGGARLQEGLAALGGFGRIFQENVLLSGRVPQISILTGTAAGGASYSPALTDFVIMVEGAAMFLTGPGVVNEAIGENVSPQELGGTKVHERNGVCHLTAPTDLEAAALARELLSYLPSSSDEPPPRIDTVPPLPGADPGAFVPVEPRRSYDMREVVRAMSDGGDLMELSPRWARNMLTAFARIEGRPVGIVANQPRYLGGVIDADAAQKAARFVRTCNSYGLPLVVLVDTPGFMPGTKQESAGVIRHGAKLLHAFAEATVPRLTVVLRKAYGGAYITMNSKDLGAHLTFAWPQAELGVMAARQAVGIVHRRDIAAADEPEVERDRLADLYAGEHLGSAIAAREGFIDEVIEPAHTRDRIAWGLDTLGHGGGGRRGHGAGNIPL
jgi:acetyl-CoA carboxylase carboxyltransferase component